MKKLYLLIALFVTSLSFGQDLIITGAYDGPLSGGTPKGIELYVVNNIPDLSIYGVGSANNGGGTDGVEFTFPADAVTAGDYIYVASETVQFQNFFGFAANYNAGSAMGINGDDAVELFKNGVVVDTFGDINTDGTGQPWDFLDGWAYRVNGTGPDGGTFVLANWTFSGTNVFDGETSNGTAATPFPAGTFSTTGSTNPSLVINSPSDGSTLPPTASTSMDVTFTVQNFNVATSGNGDGHIHYNIDNGSNVVKLDTNPITITGLAAGAHTVFMQLVDDNHTPISPAVNATVNFSIAAINQVSTITALRAGTQGDFYELTGEAIITYTRTSRNQKYIEDPATAAAKVASGSGILIDDSAGAITTAYNVGDGITGLMGRLSSFGGVLQLVPLEDPGAASSTGNTVTPEIVTASELAANWENYESELVKINSATFVGATGNFAAGTNYTINDGTSDLTFRTNFSEADYIGTAIPTTPQNLVVLVGEFNGTPQVIARALADITLRVQRNAIEGFSLYPNPVTNGRLTINTFSNTDKEIQIFDILGKRMLTTTLKGRELNVSRLNSGIYILKISEEGKTATRKLIIE